MNKIIFYLYTYLIKTSKNKIMHLIRKSSLKTNRMGRFEKQLRLDVAFTHIQTQESYLGKNNTLSGYFITD